MTPEGNELLGNNQTEKRDALCETKMVLQIGFFFLRPVLKDHPNRFLCPWEISSFWIMEIDRIKIEHISFPPTAICSHSTEDKLKRYLSPLLWNYVASILKGIESADAPLLFQIFPDRPAYTLSRDLLSPQERIFVSSLKDKISVFISRQGEWQV